MGCCKKCGAVLDEDAVFCTNCGMKVMVSEVALAENQAPTLSEKKEATDTEFNKADTGVTEPVYSTEIGFFRYNFEKECLEFINYQTKIVACVWNIPSDQWNSLPSQEQYCADIVAQENKNVFQARKYVKKIVGTYVFLIIGTFVIIYMLSNFGGNLGEAGFLIGIVIWFVIAFLILVRSYTNIKKD